MMRQEGERVCPVDGEVVVRGVQLSPFRSRAYLQSGGVGIMAAHSTQGEAVPNSLALSFQVFFLYGLVGDLVVRIWKRGDRICLRGL